MAKGMVPLRPANDAQHRIDKGNKEMLTYWVLTGCDKEAAYLLWHPTFKDPNGKLNGEGKKECRQFFNYARNKEYADDYRKTVEEFIGGKVKPGAAGDKDIDGDALARKLLGDLAAMIEEGVIHDIELIKTASDILNKYGVLKGSEEKKIAPIRVLPSRCSECRMRIAVESMVLNGEMLDMCQYCKCRRIAEDNGFRFNDGKNLLEIPQEVIAELESRNNVKMEDILNGKVEN